MSRIKRELSARWLALRLAVAGRAHQYPEILSLRRFIAAFGVDCVFDVGANHGQYAQMLRNEVGFSGTILSFEPNPDVFAALKRTATGDPRWHVFNMALSDSDGTAQFNIMAADQFSSLERPIADQDAMFAERNAVTRSVPVDCRRLDSLFAKCKSEFGFARPFLKMDTQGHDLSVCGGALGVLHEMTGVQTELSMRTLYEGGTGYQAMIDWLESAGFVPSAMFANNKGHFPLLVEMDGIFVNKGLLPDLVG